MSEAKNKDKEKIIPGINDHFKGIMSSENTVKATDPLWERYMYSGKKALERRDILRAQQFYWAACFELCDVVRDNPKVKMNDLARNVLTDGFVLSNDYFFQDPNSSNIQDTPAMPDLVVQADEKPRVDEQMQKLLDEQTAFDKKHPDFDGGARLRMIHLRRRIEYNNMLLPFMEQLFGTDDDITKILSEELSSDTLEYKDLAGQG